MLGNLKGWIIAAVLAAVLGLLTYQAVQFNQITPATALASDPTIYKPLALAVPPASIVTMEKEGDGTTAYRDAIAEVKRRRSTYEKYAEDGMATTTADLPAVQSIIDAGPLAESSVLDPATNIGYVVESDDVKALVLAADCCMKIGLLNDTSNPTRAKKCYDAVLALGSKMFDERISFYEAFDGIGRMRSAVKMLSQTARKNKDDDTATKLDAFDQSLKDNADKLDRLWQIIGSVDSTQIATHAGDVYLFTGTAMKERMWRIESILKLGRHKFNVARLADSAAVNRRLREIKSTEKDPAILLAVQAAENLTLADYHMVGR